MKYETPLGWEISEEEKKASKYYDNTRRRFRRCWKDKDGKLRTPYNSRWVMEMKLGHKLPSNIIVHHINNIKTDDSIRNLLVISHQDHASLHHKTPTIYNDNKLYRRCRRCKVFLPLESYFTRRKDKSTCDACLDVLSKEKKKLRPKRKSMTAEEKKAKRREYYLKNKDRIIEQATQYRVNNPSKVKEYQKRYRDAKRKKVEEKG